ncbi:MAG: hypothetical protein WCP15_03135 [bacterium]
MKINFIRLWLLRLFIINFVLLPTFFISVNLAYAETVISESGINYEYIMTATGSPYIIDHNVSFLPGSNFIMEPGVTMQLKNNAGISILSGFTIKGGEVIPVVFSGAGRINLRNVNGDISHALFKDGSSLSILNSAINLSDVTFASSTAEALRLYDISKLYAERIHIFGADSAIRVSANSILNIKDSEFSDNKNGIFFDPKVFLVNGEINSFISNFIKFTSFFVLGKVRTVLGESSVNSVSNSIFERISGYGIQDKRVTFGEQIDARNNWWGSALGPKGVGTNINGGTQILGNISSEPWLSLRPIITSSVKCCSNIVFIPGIQASELYKEGVGGSSKKLWIPWKNGDVTSLYLDKNGKSITAGIFAKNILNTAYTFNIYESFTEFMDSITGAQKEISEWKPLPYDWRMNVGGIAKGMIEDLRSMASSSKTGKVSIIAHSNGGLVAKALVKELSRSGDSGLVDSLIFVAVPHFGTPKSIPSLLHGDYQEIPPGSGIMVNKGTAKGFAEHMQGAFALLPSENLFSRISNNVITFALNIKNASWFPKIYGKGINGTSTLKEFFIGENGQRKAPPLTDNEKPNVLLASFIDEANSVHSELDSWIPPDGIRAVSIVGTGLPTISGLNYFTKTEKVCGPSGCTHPVYLKRSENFDVNGDGTVLEKSAFGNSSSSYVLDLAKYNSRGLLGLGTDRSHASILEVSQVRDLIKSIIIPENIVSGIIKLPEYISKVALDFQTSLASDTKSSYVRFSTFSPVDMVLTDKEGNKSWIENSSTSDLITVHKGIRGTIYDDSGDGSFLIPASTEVSVSIKGNDEGFFGFEIAKMNDAGDGNGLTVSTTTSFSDVPVNTFTEATYEYSPAKATSSLSVDMDGDGKKDIDLMAGKELSLNEQILFIEGHIRALSLQKKIEDRFIKILEKIRLDISKGKIKKADKLVDRLVAGMYGRLQADKEKVGYKKRGHRKAVDKVMAGLLATDFEFLVDSIYSEYMLKLINE